jgi:hypothetical protein
LAWFFERKKQKKEFLEKEIENHLDDLNYILSGDLKWKELN